MALDKNNLAINIYNDSVDNQSSVPFLLRLLWKKKGGGGEGGAWGGRRDKRENVVNS